MQEVWKTIEGHEDYMASSKGRIAKIIKGDSNGKGYRFIRFLDGKRVYIHKIIAQLFMPNPNNLPIVNHKDGNKENNKIENLEWCTYSHNNKEAYRLGLRKPVTRKVIQKTLDGKEIKIWNSMKEIEETTGIPYTGISACCRGKTKTSYGYKWEYVDKNKGAGSKYIFIHQHQEKEAKA